MKDEDIEEQKTLPDHNNINQTSEKEEKTILGKLIDFVSIVLESKY